MARQRALGWVPETKASRKSLHARAIPFRLLKNFAEPEEVDHRVWRADHVEDQGNIGSCVGHGYSSGGEVLNFIDTKGNQDKYCRLAAYRWAQMQDGITGAQSGAMVSGALKAAKSMGFAREELWPYDPRKYALTVPQACVEDGKNRLLIGQHAIGRSYDEVFNWLASGVGVVIVGIPWYESFANTTGVIEKIAGRSLGGHCVIWHGYTKRKDAQGRKYILGENSHSPEYGDGGFMEFAPVVVITLCNGIPQGNEIILWTDIQNEELKPRKIDFTDMVA